MPHLFFFRLEILFRVQRGRDFAGHTLHNFDAAMLQRRDFIRIIRQQFHLWTRQGSLESQQAWRIPARQL